MPVIVDQHMREQITHEGNLFPISFFENELSELPNREGPLHWHPDFEIARAETGTLDYQVGQKHILLQAGDSLFVNRTLLHSVRQVAGDLPDPMPVIVFSGTLIAPETSTIYQKYIAPIADCDSLPFVVLRRQEDWCNEIRGFVDDIFANLKQRKDCYEMAVQRDLSRLFEPLFCHLDALPRTPGPRMYSSVRRCVCKKCWPICMPIMQNPLHLQILPRRRASAEARRRAVFMNIWIAPRYMR